MKPTPSSDNTAAWTPAVGKIIAHYRIIAELGSGGMGEILQAEDLELQRQVALKIMSPARLANPRLRQEVIEEAQIAASINHPNIATIYELGHEAQLSFIAMEFVEGETLRQRMKRNAFEAAAAIEVVMQVAEALHAAHQHRIIHCDIHPSNIMLTAGGLVKVLDFGLARLAPNPSAQLAVATANHEDDGFFAVTARPAALGLAAATHPNGLAGTIDYMSPEQLRGDALDARTDLFSLGAVFYEMLAGQRPFEGRGATDVWHSIQTVEPPRLGAFRDDAPLELENIIRKCLQKNRDERYASAAALLSDLRRLKNQLDLTSRQTAQTLVSLPEAAAFRGLLPFQEGDRDRFYGRQVDTLALFDMIAHDEFRFGVLFGDSGCGKTSLLKAGLLPKLWEEGYAPIFCRSYKDPIEALVEECCKRSQLIPGKDESAPAYLLRVADELTATLVIVYDQFEEFFVHFSHSRECEPFLILISECCNNVATGLKFLFSMRSDFLYHINAAFAGRISEPLMSSKLYHLRNFDEAQTAEIIAQSAHRAKLPFAPELSGCVAADLANNNVVLPSELQIVGEQLQRKRIVTPHDYRRAGGKDALVHSFLEDVVQSSGEKEAAQLLLRSLISDENTRMTLSRDEIATRIQRNRDAVDRLLDLFAQSRLVNVIQDEEPWRYELMHEYLIGKINQLTHKVMDATQRANRLLRQYLSRYSVEKTTRIPISDLWRIKRYSDIKDGEQTQELMRKSLWLGLTKAGATVSLMIVITITVAALFSVQEEWEELRLRDGHTAAVRQVALSPDGRLLVSGGEDGKVIVWDFVKRIPLATFTDHKDWVSSVAFSPTGEYFASGSYDHTAIIWDTRQLKNVRTLGGHQYTVNAVAFSPDGRLFASGDNGQTMLWETRQWKKVQEFPLGQSYGRLFFSPTGRQLFFNMDGWDLSTGQPVELASQEFAGNWVALSPDSTRLVTIDGMGIVRFGDLARSKPIEYRAHRDNGRAVAFSPDGRLLATGAEDIILWDPATQTKLLRLEHTAIVWNLNFTPDGRSLISTHGDGSILLWDVMERERVANFNEHSGPVRAIAFSSDGKRLASAGEDRSVIIWNLEQGRKEAVLVGHTTRIVGVAFSPDGKWLASCDRDAVVTLWDLTQHRPRWNFNYRLLWKYPRPSDCLTISPDGRWLVTSYGVIESTQGRLVVDFTGFPHIYGADFSANGKQLVSVIADGAVGEITLWDADNWRVSDSLRFDSQLISVSFSPDGKSLVTGEDEGAVRLWKVKPLRQVAVIGRHQARIKSVAFSPDGRTVASASDDHTIALWDVERRRLITRIGTHNAPVLAVAFSPDGKHLASGEHDKSVRLYTRHQTLWGKVLDP